MDYLIIGAGSIGSALGANLQKNGFSVTLVANSEHTKQINQNGLSVVTQDGSFKVKIPCFDSIENIRISEKTIILMTMKFDRRFEKTLLEMKEKGFCENPIVCFQNGVEAEKIAMKYCSKLYGGVARMTCTIRKWGELSYAKQGIFIVGKYPSGTDEICDKIKANLENVGFKIGIAPEIISDEYLKILVNLNSATHALFKNITENPVKLAEIKFNVLREGIEVFEKAGINPYPSCGLGSTKEEMLENFKEPKEQKFRFQTYNSTWQNLYWQKEDTETKYFNGLVISLGRELGITTPYNERICELVAKAHTEKLGPDYFDINIF
ncbi:MAG: ketopantoate reductase family protein [Calditrichaeota bacterium]|nr:MAG: ketopantoate reductase family protein [Calditrichota bacterium]